MNLELELGSNLKSGLVWSGLAVANGGYLGSRSTFSREAFGLIQARDLSLKLQNTCIGSLALRRVSRFISP